MIGVATQENGRARFCLLTGDELEALRLARELRNMGAHGVDVIDLRTLAEINVALADADTNDLPEPS
jgi:hypothetical protein